jgi:hypothetical protein
VESSKQMPKKKKDEVPMAPLPAIDHAYVQALKIQTLVRCLPPLHMCVYITALMIAGGALVVSASVGLCSFSFVLERDNLECASASSPNERLPHDQEERNEARTPKT